MNCVSICNQTLISFYLIRGAFCIVDIPAEEFPIYQDPVSYFPQSPLQFVWGNIKQYLYLETKHKNHISCNSNTAFDCTTHY